VPSLSGKAVSVFNLIGCDNDFERDFAKFLDNAPDVEAFSKLPRAFGFSIEYTDAAMNLRNYEPDFVAVDKPYSRDWHSHGTRRREAKHISDGDAYSPLNHDDAPSHYLAFPRRVSLSRPFQLLPSCRTRDF
jgi:Endonuclease domain